jgi:hypothetical protein
MLDKLEAKEKVCEYLLSKYPGAADNWAIHEKTLDQPYGWVFFYDHKRYIQENDRRARLAGNGPILVDRTDGTIRQFGTADPLQFYLNEYERQKGYEFTKLE